MSEKKIGIVNDFEGANPQGKEGVKLEAPGKFLIRPWSEDGDGCYKFCLNVKARNESGVPAPIELHIEWEDAEYMDCRDYVLLGKGDDWRSLPATVSGTMASVTLTIPPGESYIAMHPVYDLKMLDAERKVAKKSGFSEKIFGKTFEGRDMVALSIGKIGAPAIFIVSRFHPYETAGTHCVSAILKELASDYAAGGPLTSSFRFVIVPIANPDGVAAGCCKRSRKGGPDLCHEGADSSDPAGKALIELLDETRPRGYLDLHGWMHRDDDGLAYSDEKAREEFLSAIRGDPLFNKTWKGRCTSAGPRKPGDFCSRACHDHGAVAFIISPSWFGRTVPDVREFGRKILAKFAEVVGRRI